MKLLNKILIIAMLLFIVLYLFFSDAEKDKVNDKNIYEFSEGKFSYSQDRGKPAFNITFLYRNESIKIYKISFKSRNFADYKTTIHSLLYVPENESKLPGIVFLPGGGVSKEAANKFSLMLANENYIVLTIDQRGIGETSGIYLGIEQDYSAFAQGYEPVNHLSVYDALRSLDVLKEIREIDKNKLTLAGESMGGRYALIAASMDNEIKGVLTISSAGFDAKRTGQAFDSYVLSIDPDSYIDKITPKKLIMLAIQNDKVTKLENSQITFDKAKEPKKLYVFNESECSHGYCEPMKDKLLEGFREIFMS